MSIRDQVNFVPHVRREWSDPVLLETGVANLIHKSDAPEEQWIVDITNNIGEWRSKAHSTYIRWALAINGLHVADRTYKDWKDDKRFRVSSLRMRDGGLTQVTVAEWKGADAAANHIATAELMAGYGVCDLYGALEEIIFAIYRIYLDHHPFWLLKGLENKELRALRKNAKTDQSLAAEWSARWKERVDAWQRKRGYDPLSSVFLAFIQQAELKAPSWFKHTTPATWAETIGGIAELRNLLTHGAANVSQALGEFSKKPYRMTFDFKEGKPLVVHLHHLMGVEFFIDQILTTLNVGLIERATGPQPQIKLLLGG